MSRRDRRWRAAGLALSVGACAIGSMHWGGPPVALASFAVAILGLILMLNGKRVPVAFAAELCGHRHTAAVIHARRLRTVGRPTR